MKKKHLAALMMAAALAASSLSACSQNSAGQETISGQETGSGQETEIKKDVSLDDVLNSIKETYGELYVPNIQMEEQTLTDVVGLSPDLYESYVAEAPMISASVETFIGVKASEGKGEEVEKVLSEYRDYLLNDTLQYPMNVPKIQASQVVRHGDYVFFVMLGGPDDKALEAGDEEALKSASENNQKAIDVINGFFE